MTTEELLNRVESRYNRTGNPSLPPDETMAAILALAKERDEAIKKNLELTEKVGSLESRLEGVKEQKGDAEFRAKEAEAKAKEHEWVANQFANFVKGVANLMYEGQEVSAARRVYDLNSGSLKMKRLRMHGFDSLDKAKETYVSETGDAECKGILGWLFQIVH